MRIMKSNTSKKFIEKWKKTDFSSYNETNIIIAEGGGHKYLVLPIERC